jgi:hypothetical protein
MKRLAVLASLLILTWIPQVYAHDGCSNADLQGTYSFVASGTYDSSPFAAAGQTTYDGNGNAAGLIQFSNGGVVTPLLSWSGTYIVDTKNCTATKTIEIPALSLTIDFFITAGDNFKELRFIATDSGTTISGTARKQ